jgi:enhancing lycopene biosynthesis protein 2
MYCTATLTKAIQDRHPEVTIGNDTATAETIEAMGASTKSALWT